MPDRTSSRRPGLWCGLSMAALLPALLLCLYAVVWAQGGVISSAERVMDWVGGEDDSDATLRQILVTALGGEPALQMIRGFLDTHAPPDGLVDRIVRVPVAGQMRQALVHVPPQLSSLSKPALVLNYHAWGSTPAIHQKFTDMDRLADSDGVIVAYPQGQEPAPSPLGWVGFSHNAGACCPGASTAGVDDVQFARALVRELVGSLGADPARVYVTGMSNGGMMVHRVVCEAGELFAAAASVAGYVADDSWQRPSWGLPPVVRAIWGQGQYQCPRQLADSSQAVPLLHIHGMKDALVPVLGSELIGMVSLQQATELHRNRLQCADQPFESFSNGSASCKSWCGIEDPQRNLTVCRVGSSGHGWPGSRWPSASTQDIDATAQIWQFFQRYTKQ